MKKTLRILRVIVAPFLLCIMLIRFGVLAFLHVVLFIKYGGEFIAYTSQDEIVQIHDIYKEIKEQRKK